MLIRKNTKAFKTIKEIITSCKDRPDRQNLIRLYITKAGHAVNDRISVEALQGDSDLFYELNYDAVLNNLESSSRQLHQSDDFPGLYYFNQSSNKLWDETPFEFDPLISKAFSSLSDLPMGRKREKQEKFIFPEKEKQVSKPPKKEKSRIVKSTQAVERAPRQPSYHLKHKIVFTELDKTVFKRPRFTKKEMLDYYDQIAIYILPYLKDHPLSLRLFSNHSPEEYKTLAALAEVVEVPDWIQGANRSKKQEQEHLLCNNKDHLLWYVEIGAVEFCCALGKSNAPEQAAYIVIEIESPKTELGKAIDVALAANSILSGLHLPSFVKIAGHSSLHVCLPVEPNNDFETSKAVAKFICRLIRLKVPELVTLEGEGAEDSTYGKVILHCSMNETGKRIVAPYSFLSGDTPTIAAPLQWGEVEEGLEVQSMDYETILKKIRQDGDPFASFFKKKINASALLQRMKENYLFLV